MSIYGWRQPSDAGFASRHPRLRPSPGIIPLRPEDAAATIPYDEFLDLVREAFEA